MINIRNHISWSQMLAIERGEEYFYKVYVAGEKFDSKEMSFGSQVADGLEEKILCDEAEFCRIYLPKPKYREHVIEVDFDGLPLLAKLDGFTKKPLIIDEYKTGRNKWTQSMVDKHGQLTVYAMAVWKKYKEIPDIRLFWIPTALDLNGEVCLTGAIPKEFKTTRTIKDFVKMYGRLKSAYERIQKFYSKL
jgi:hypothetical protein